MASSVSERSDRHRHFEAGLHPKVTTEQCWLLRRPASQALSGKWVSPQDRSYTKSLSLIRAQHSYYITEDTEASPEQVQEMMQTSPSSLLCNFPV